MSDFPKRKRGALTPYLSPVSACALSIGCIVGWGAFMMPGNAFLPVAGPLGAVIGVIIGGLVILIVSVNYHYLMDIYPDPGGTYTFVKQVFSYDHGFLCAWFLGLTYIAILWANATALPLIGRFLLGDTFQFGFTYEVAGFQVYFGEILMAMLALAVAGLICMRKRFSAVMQVALGVLLFVGIVVCFIGVWNYRPEGVAAALSRSGGFSARGMAGIWNIVALAPWAFIGFEAISHSAEEFTFPRRKVLGIFTVAIVISSICYILPILIAASVQPERYSGWRDYVAALRWLGGLESAPTFYAVYTAMGRAGGALIAVTAIGTIMTSLVGNTISISRLLVSLSEDELLPEWIGRVEDGVPKNAVCTILLVSVPILFLGRTATSWIVDVTTVGAVIAYAFTSACALHVARERNNKTMRGFAVAGLAISLLFILLYLLPNLLAVNALSTESYLILSVWSVLGFAVFHLLFRKDKSHRLGRSTVTWVVLLALIIFTSMIWMRQATEQSTEQAVAPIRDYYAQRLQEAGFDAITEATAEPESYLRESLLRMSEVLTRNSLIQTATVVIALAFLFLNYSMMTKRGQQMEMEKLLAEENSRAKTSFLSNMSHEIRTPMNAIIGLDAMALKEPDLPPKTREQLEKIGSSANHLLGLINDILDMSRIESGRMTLKTAEFPLREFLAQINIIVDGQCQDKGLRYEPKVIGSMADYYIGDDLKLKQVLINILGNAVKFTPAPGTVSFTTEEIARDEDSCTLRFVIRDTGVGMDKSYIPKIFDAFSQEHENTSNRYGSTGLGMSITKNLVEMMNGTIEVDSEKDVGSTFTVTVKLGASARIEAPAEEKAVPEQAAISLEGKLVLVAEDVEINAEILIDLLDMEGVRAVHAENGRIALELFTKSEVGSYDAILMDMRMPEMDGLEATRAIRALKRPDAETVPIIALTANAFDEDVQNCLRAGMNAHLSKPIDPEKLITTLSQLLAEA